MQYQRTNEKIRKLQHMHIILKLNFLNFNSICPGVGKMTIHHLLIVSGPEPHKHKLLRARRQLLPGLTFYCHFLETNYAVEQ